MDDTSMDTGSEKASRNSGKKEVNKNFNGFEEIRDNFSLLEGMPQAQMVQKRRPSGSRRRSRASTRSKTGVRRIGAVSMSGRTAMSAEKRRGRKRMAQTALGRRQQGMRRMEARRGRRSSRAEDGSISGAKRRRARSRQSKRMPGMVDAAGRINVAMRRRSHRKTHSATSEEGTDEMDEGDQNVMTPPAYSE